ncbi:MAG: hypothetical protein M5U12_29315 [Verrucomicrobia bacterium]|nr:hypothetical protein [Verrucomicrobiota bacterium]
MLQAWKAGNPSRARALVECQHHEADEADLRGFERRCRHGLFAPREVATLSVHEGAWEVWASAWSPDGKHVALGRLFGHLELWDWREDRLVARL